jgi:hypothetical protein
MMAMKYHNPALGLDRLLELRLWKEATQIFMTSGLGGCGPFGLVVAAQRRGYRAGVVLSDRQTPFLTTDEKAVDTCGEALLETFGLAARSSRIAQLRRWLCVHGLPVSRPARQYGPDLTDDGRRPAER